ncbi:MAG: BamA/TamA family outer membrane protein [Bradymonadaceae bacterium]|nr:BamA/TamA family outer membrane protein [Lujinxingiaceae bacterium]
MSHDTLKLLVVLTSLTLFSCAGAEQREDYIVPGTTIMRVESLDIRGVDRFSLSEIKAGLATRQDPGWRASVAWLPVIGQERRFYNFFDWRRDVERILVFYRQRGYFNAEVLTESIVESPERNSVRITLSIDEGLPVEVSGITLEGLNDTIGPRRDELLADLPLEAGDVFTQASYLASREAISSRLKQAGHAYAEVAGRVFVMPEQNSAEVIFYVDPGPETVFGQVHIFGLEDVEERFVREALPFSPGQRYTPERLFEAQKDIYDLGVFGLVTVLPGHEARELVLEDPVQAKVLEDIQREGPAEKSGLPVEELVEDKLDELQEREGKEAEPLDVADEPLTDPPPPGPLGVSGFLASAQEEAEQRSQLSEEVPIVVRLKEAKKYRVRLGVGIAAEDTRQDVRGLVNWSSRNFLGGLRKLEHITAAGYAWAPGFLRPEDTGNEGVLLSTELRFSQPQFFERRTNFRMRARVERDVREGFTVWNPLLRLSVDRPFFRRLILELAYSVAYFNYSNINEGLLDLGATGLGLDFRPEFLLETLEQTVSIDYRDDVLNPTRGFIARFALAEAGRYLIGGEFDYVRAVVSGEAYVPFELFTSNVLAMRTRLGSVYNVGRDTGVPVQSRLNSGGTDGMRAFGRRRLSLFTQTGDPVPVGGLTMFEASVEPRFRIARSFLDVGDFWGAMFVDAATVLQGQFLFGTTHNDQGTESWADIAATTLYGIGAGVWWVTPVGPLRLDGALLLSDIRDDERFRRCVDPRTVGTQFCDFVPLDEDPIQRLVPGYSFYLSIGHSF